MPLHKILYWSEYLPKVMIKLVALTARNTVAQHLVALCLFPRLPESIISQIFDDFFRGMYPLTSRCFCSCLSCLPYSERARVRCLGLHSRNPAVEHFQERQWIQPPWNIALKIWSSNIYSILYMAKNIHMNMALSFFLDMFTHLTFLTIWSHSLFSAASHLSFSFNIDRGTSR